jgi:hypothetical protein
MNRSRPLPTLLFARGGKGRGIFNVKGITVVFRTALSRTIRGETVAAL